MAQAEELMTITTQCSSVQVQYRCRKLAPTEVLIGENVLHTVVKELALTNIDSSRAEADQSLNLCLLVTALGRGDVDMESVLCGLG